jgi:PAS domain S-box-containing protein
MGIDPQVLRAEQHVEVGELLQRDASILIERWCRRAVAEQPNAARAHHSALRDQLASLLQALGRTLAESTDYETCLHRIPAIEHGDQRWETGWSLPELVRDYQILRLVILEYLEETLDRPLRSREIMAVGLALDEAIAASVGMYVSNRESYIRQIEQERAERDRQAAEALRKWEQIFKEAGWGVAIVHAADNTLETVNPAYARLHGYTVNELLGRPLADFLALETRTAMLEHSRNAEHDGDHVYESIHVRKDGSRFTALTHVTALKDRDGHTLYQAVNLQDITQQKQLEESLRQHAQALEETHQRKDEFLAMLAHELRNPLASILNAVEVLRRIGPGEPLLHEARDIVERQVKQMVRLVDDLLDVSRIGQGKVQLRKEPVALAPAVAQAVQTTSPLFEARQHQLSVAVTEEPLWLDADQARLVQILVNLLTNAAKYTDPGGRVWLEVQRSGVEAVLRVRDTGMGIAPETLPQIFELFAQGDGVPERVPGGLGIGLALVRRLVELHGGQIGASSQGLGLGSEFVVRLPVCTAAAPREAAAAASETPAAATARHVLIVEDNADARETLKTLLRLQGHQVETAEDGLRGVEQILVSRPQVALIDLGLPGLDGIDVARQVRGALGDRVFLVALTGFGQEDDRRRTLDAGFNAHLLKPVDLEELARLLASVPVGNGSQGVPTLASGGRQPPTLTEPLGG